MHVCVCMSMCFCVYVCVAFSINKGRSEQKVSSKTPKHQKCLCVYRASCAPFDGEEIIILLQSIYVCAHQCVHVWSVFAWCVCMCMCVWLHKHSVSDEMFSPSICSAGIYIFRGLHWRRERKRKRDKQLCEEFGRQHWFHLSVTRAITHSQVTCGAWRLLFDVIF